MTLRIDRCICHARSFASVLDEARAAGANTLQDALAACDFGGNCGLCHPYVERGLRTGETVFHEVLPKDREPDAA